jgi:hypothetical protein
MKVFSSVILASILTALSVPAFADASVPQNAAEAGARPQLAEVHPSGTVSRYIVGPAGHVRGFMLQDGTVVFTGRRGDKMAADVAVGQTVRIDGRTAAGAPNVVLRAKVFGPHGEITNPAGEGGGNRAQWKSLDPAQRKELRQERRQKRMEELAKLPPTSLDGTVQTVLTGRKGNPRALILSNGSNVVLEHSLTHAMNGAAIKPGDVIHASGKGGTYKNGASIEASELTLANGTRFSGKSL